MPENTRWWFIGQVLLGIIFGCVLAVVVIALILIFTT
jgi:hypothetical protein